MFHFVNCLALACVPYFMTYKFTGLAEYGSFWKCAQAGSMYMVTQLCKMLLLATFFPTGDSNLTTTVVGGVDVVHEFLKSTVDLADLAGLHVVMTKIAGKGETKFLVAGLGWASAEFVMTRFIPLWVGAGGLEFDWRYLQLSFDSNISLMHYIMVATLVWLWSRHTLNRTHVPIVLILLAVACYRPLLVELILQVFSLGPWTVLIFKAIATTAMGIITLHVYLSLAQTMNSY